MTKSNPMTDARRKAFVTLYHTVSDASLDAMAMANDCHHDESRSQQLYEASRTLYRALLKLRRVLDEDDDRRRKE